MAAMAQHVQSFQLREEVDANFVAVGVVALDGHSTRSEEYVLVSERYTYSRPQLGYSDGPRDGCSRSTVSHVEEWIDQELFGDVVETSHQLQDEGELCFTTLRKHVDEYFEIVDLLGTVTPSFSYNIDEEQDYMGCHGTDDVFLSPEGSDHQKMYYIDEPQLWCFTR